MDTTPEYVIEMLHITKVFPGIKANDDITLQLKKGEIHALLGENGAGKSTTIRHLMGFSKPDSGVTKIEGRETFARYYEVLKDVGYIPGEIALPAGLTGWEFLKMMQDMQGKKNEERLKYMLDLFELKDGELKGDTKRMSLGVKRKLAVVAANMSDPKVLILDEPTSGLDPVMQENFIGFIHEEKKRGKTILLSSHIFSEIDSTCDRIAIIKDGKIVSQFVANELKHATRKFYSLEFNYEKDLKEFLGKTKEIKSFTLLENSGAKCFASIEDKDLNKLIAILSSSGVKSFSNRKESLEDYFMKFYKEDKDFKGALK